MKVELDTDACVRRNVAYLPLYFVGYSLVGWIYEVILVIVRDGRFVNRGFLAGPWLPIYGVGGLLVYWLIYPHMNRTLMVSVGHRSFDAQPFLTLVLISCVAAAVELCSTYVLDFFHVDWTALWQYYDFRWNFDGRIAILPSVVFGVCGWLMIKYVQPLLESVQQQMHRKWVKWCYYVLILMFTVDICVHLRIGSHYTDVAIWTFGH